MGPTKVIGWLNGTVEQEMEVVSEIAKRFRSQKTSVGLSPGARPAGFVRHQDADQFKSLSKLETRISRIAGMGDIKILAPDAAPPKGTLQDVVNDKCLIFTEVAGLDLSQELAKLEKKVISAEKMVKSYEDKMAAPGYEEKVPEKVRETNAQKHQTAMSELEELRRAVASIKEAMA